MALGATGRTVLTMALSQGMRPVLAGLAVGAAASWWLGRYLTSLLFDIRPFDLVTYLTVAALLVFTALLACYLPGRRAARIDPAMALRME